MLYAAFILGLLGSWHCVGMCGPIAMIIPGSKGKNRIYSILLYHFGKILTYILIGSLIGLLGVFLNSLRIQSLVTIVAGSLMLIIAVLPVILNQLEKKGYAFFSSYFKFKNRIVKALDKNKLEFSFYIGFLNGFIPCGMVYMAAITAMTQTTFTDSLLFMLFFGLGTAPFLSLLIFFSDYAKNKFRRHATLLRGLAFGLVGVFMLWKGVKAYSVELDAPKEGDHFQVCGVVE